MDPYVLTCFKDMLHSSYIGEVSLVEDPQLQLQRILVRISVEFLCIIILLNMVVLFVANYLG